MVMLALDAPVIPAELPLAERESAALFALLGLWMVDAFGQVERIVGFRRQRGRGAGWFVAVERTGLFGWLEPREVWPAAVGALAGQTAVDAQWSEYAWGMIAHRLQEQSVVLCQHLADAVCVARARRYWSHLFEVTGSGPLWTRADAQEDRLRRRIILRRACRTALPPEAVDLLRRYLEAGAVEPRFQSAEYRALCRRLHDERDPLGRSVWRFVMANDQEVWRFARQFWSRFEDRFQRARERRLERWCAAQPGVAYCHPAG